VRVVPRQVRPRKRRPVEDREAGLRLADIPRGVPGVDDERVRPVCQVSRVKVVLKRRGRPHRDQRPVYEELHPVDSTRISNCGPEPDPTGDSADPQRRFQGPNCRASDGRTDIADGGADAEVIEVDGPRMRRRPH
jgi:hypothetical protein